MDISKLVQLKWSVQEKLNTLQRVNGEIMVLIDDEGELTEDIEQVDDSTTALRSYGEDCMAQRSHAHYDAYAWSCTPIRLPLGSGPYTYEYSGEAA